MLHDPHDLVESMDPDQVAALPFDECVPLLLNYAVLAPSPHNTQPWLWHVDGERVELFADRRRWLPHCDPDARELLMACGSALESLLIALAAHGQPTRYRVNWAPEQPDLIAELTHDPAGPPWEGPPGLTAGALLRAIPRRRSVRSSFVGGELPVDLRSDLARDASAFGVQVQFPDAQLRSRLCTLVMAGDRRQMADRAFREELSAWIRPTAHGSVDGMPAALLGERGTAGEVTPLVVRTFDLGDRQATVDAELMMTAPQLITVTTGDDSPAQVVRCGQALLRLLLVLQVHGYAAAIMNQPCEVPHLRQELGAALGARPQAVLRVGRAVGTTGRSPRRQVADVLV